MKILLCGGGTSGHVNPAIAIAEAIKKERKDVEFLFIGRDGGFENKSVNRAKIPLKTITVQGLKRTASIKNLKRITLAVKAYNDAKGIIKEFSPDIVIGTGGYVSWPVIKAAQKLKIPTVIHESNAYPGLTTKLLAPKCDLVLLNYESTADHLKRVKKAISVGNPLRSEFNVLQRHKVRRELGISDNEIFILSFGGSGGAASINDTVLALMKNHISKTKGVRHLHATGKKYYETLPKESVECNCKNCKIVPFIDDMPKLLSAADIVISRSGALTVSELSLVGACSVLIPSPNVTDNHQYKNAKLLSDSSACIMIEEKELSEDILREKLTLLIRDSETRKELGKRIRKFATPNASVNAAKKILEICQK